MRIAAASAADTIERCGTASGARSLTNGDPTARARRTERPTDRHLGTRLPGELLTDDRLDLG